MGRCCCTCMGVRQLCVGHVSGAVCQSPSDRCVHGAVSTAVAVRGVPVRDKRALLTRGAFRVAALARVLLCTWGPGRLAHL